MIQKENILEAVKLKGPLLPIDLKQEFKLDTTILGALLSEFVVNKLVKATFVKKGGSPFYYVLGQERKLEELTSFLNEKDKKTYDLIKEKKILFDDEQEPLIRVSLRQIKDYAKSLKVNFFGQARLLWKYYLVKDEEVEVLLKGRYNKKQAIIPENKLVQATNSVKEQLRTTTMSTLDDKKGDFLSQIISYLGSKEIEILSKDVVRAKSEVEFRIMLPTNIGKIEYFCKARKKKTCNDGDLSSAYVKGASLNLPVLFITTGKITKKAKAMIGKEFKGLILKEI